MPSFNLEDSLTNEKLIKNSIYYAIYARLNEDHFCNFFELNFNCKDTNKINDLVQHIKKIYSLVEPYTQDKSFAYYYPKGEFL